MSVAHNKGYYLECAWHDFIERYSIYAVLQIELPLELENIRSQY